LRASKLNFIYAAQGAIFLLVLVGMSACATAPAPFDPLPLGKSVSAPTGFLQFCGRRPDQCQALAALDLTDAPVAGAQGAAHPDYDLKPVSLVFQRTPLAGADQFARRGQDDAGVSPGALLLKSSYLPGAASTQEVAMDLGLTTRSRPTTASRPSDRVSRKSYAVLSESASGARLRFSADLQAEIGDVNGAINRAITPRTDMEAFGVDNYWTLPLTDGPRPEGNCKHYALEKRRQLVDDGVPANALSLAIVTTPAEEVHAVLVISTDQGDLVLDNLTNEIRPWRQTGYRWLVRQTPGAPLRWVEANRAG
jgi:predicted transglutaminase-like cysteine proteinase